MPWKYMLIMCLIIMALDGSLAKKRQLVAGRAAECLKCFDEINALKKSNGSGPAAQSGYKPHFFARLGLRKDLPPSCIVCTKLLQMKGKRRNHPKGNANSFKKPKLETTFDQNFVLFRRRGNVPPVKTPCIIPPPKNSNENPTGEVETALSTQASDNGPQVNYHYHYHYFIQSPSDEEEQSDENSEKFSTEPIDTASTTVPDETPVPPPAPGETPAETSAPGETEAESPAETSAPGETEAETSAPAETSTSA